MELRYKEEDKVFMRVAEQVSKQSPDPSRKTGVVLVLANGGEVRSFNQFPHNVKPRLERPEKYSYIEHAERHAIYWCAYMGYKTAHSVMYLTWFPCADCARAIVGAGVRRLVCMEPNWDEKQYKFDEALVILTEGEVDVEYAGVYGEVAKG